MLIDTLQADLALAQKAHDQVKIDTLRFLLGAAFYLRIEKGKDYELTDADMVSVLQKQVKTHQESIEMFLKAKRQDLVDRENAELAILQAYLPEQMSEEEVRSRILEIKEKNKTSDFGTFMKLVMGELRGKVDGGLVAKLVKEVLGV